MDETSTFVMSLRSWTPEWIIAIRLGLACVLGGLIGLEREIGNHDAGLRTHILVALASCVFTLVAWELYQHIRSIEQPATGDPVRIIEAVTAGAGFLAAGITTVLVLIVLFGLGVIKKKMGWDAEGVPDDRMKNPAVPTSALELPQQPQLSESKRPP